MSEQDPIPTPPPGSEGAPAPEASAAPQESSEPAPQASAEAPAPEETKHHHHPRKSMGRKLKTVLVRLYTFALLTTVAVVCMSAIIYLFKFVFTPAKLPPAFAQWQGQLDPAALRQEHVPGVTTGAGRAPMSHYHKVDRWFQPDPTNNCTVSGCHSPLPHDPASKIAAFPNLHVTFLDCLVCHEQPGNEPIQTHWVSIATAQKQNSPAVLRLIALLEAMPGDKSKDQELHPQVITLLKEMVATSKPEREIEDLQIQIETSVPSSPVWTMSVHELKHRLPGHARGEYAAKVVRDFSAIDQKKLPQQTKSYLSTTDAAAKKSLEKEMHKGIIAKPNACATCHAKEPNILNFSALGYAPTRVNSLQTLPLARMVQQIRSGESFQLPKLLESGSDK